VTSGVVAVIFSLLVVSNAILGWIFLRQPLSRAFLIGSAVAMLGVGLLFAHEWHAGDRAPHDAILGVVMTLVAVVSASIGNVMQAARRARAMPMQALIGWAMLCGAVIDGLFAWAFDGPPRFDGRGVYIAGLLYLGVIASAIAFWLYFNLIRQIGPARGGYVNVLVPVIAMGLSTVFEGYRWSAEAIAGGVLVLIGLVLAMRARSPAR
jgi:drug/metabolite transporter (DMT)-like permease